MFRLYLRQHKWIRSSHINYPEVGSSDELALVLQQLVDKKLLMHCESAHVTLTLFYFNSRKNRKSTI